MSLVGTRPPTLDEWEKYEPHHRARMSFRPGLTGLWQVSGRSNITDFEEVVKLDTKYTLMQNVSERWHVVYLVPAIIGFVMSLFALLFARETNAFLTKRIEYLKTPIEEREQRSKEGREQNAQGGILTAVKFAFRHRQLRFLIIACCP